MTAEQKARDLLQNMDIEEAESFTSGDLVELANLIRDKELYQKDKKRLDWFDSILQLNPTQWQIQHVIGRPVEISLDSGKTWHVDFRRAIDSVLS